MVCKKCEKKLSKLACPEVFKSSDRGSSSRRDKRGESSGRKLNENKYLASKNKYKPYTKASCRLCHGVIHQTGRKYCQECAYKKGVCAMCGKMILDTKMYKQSGH